MTPKWPDKQLRREIRDFNREFLDLVCQDPRPGAAYGLPPAVRQRLAGLAPAQLDAIADTPCLLVTVAASPGPGRPGGVADGPCPPAVTPAEPMRLFAAALLTWLWHTARQDRLLAALCIGPERHAAEQLATAGFRDLQRAAAGADLCLEARFCRHPRLWPDLVRAASRPNPQVLTAARLSAVQLTLISRN
jgi:hypothetical protein